MGIDDPSAREHYSAINAQCWLDYEKGQITQEEVKVRRFREYLALYGVDAKPEEVTERYADALAEQCILLDGALDVLKAGFYENAHRVGHQWHWPRTAPGGWKKAIFGAIFKQ